MSKIIKKKVQNIEELVLPSSKLKFCNDQLQHLNYAFTRNLTQELDPEYNKAILLAKSVTERLIQRLLCGVGFLDQRFSTKFLVDLHDNQLSNSSRSLEYLLRLDVLSKPSLYQSDQIPKYSIIENDIENCPSGYARIRMHPSCNKIWGDLINSSGYLRRDKVQAKVVELLAQAASGETPNSPLNVDESILCGSPGKVVDALTLHYILKRPANEQVFYGAAGSNPRFTELKDFRLAIVDEPSGIRLRVGFLSPALSAITIDVRLLVAIGLDVWPSTTNFPFRISVSHSDCVLYHKSAQTGIYLTGYGVQSSAWQIRLPAAELVLLNHYDKSSTVQKILQTLYQILQKIDEEYKQDYISYKILNFHTLKTALFYHLEKDTSSPSDIILNWSSKYLSTHVLKILDKLIPVLKNQRQPNYFFPNANLFINPGHLCEDDFILESNKIQSYMLRFFDQSLMSLKVNDDFKQFLTSQKAEILLLQKWKETTDELMPPPSTRGRRICFAGAKHKTEIVYTQYTLRQLEYIGIVLKNILTVKQLVLQNPDEHSWKMNLKFLHLIPDSSIEDVIYVLVTLIEQARDQYLKSLPNTAAVAKIKTKLRRQFDTSTSKLIELVRNEKEIAKDEHLDDVTLVKIILTWLYRGLDHNKKGLAPILRPYLSNLFVSSHTASWHLDVIKQKGVSEEADALGKFALLVNDGKITPAQGLVDSVNKNWIWAEDMLKIINRADLRLIFLPARGKVSKHILSLPKEDQSFEQSFEMMKESYCSTVDRRKSVGKLMYNNIIESSVIGKEDDFMPWYCVLRDSSSMTKVFSHVSRRGMHRCCGDILQTLMAMQKINILQEISILLPNDKQIEILEALQKLTMEKLKKPIKSRFNTFTPSTMKKKRNSDFESELKEKYTQQEESAGVQEQAKKQIVKKKSESFSLRTFNAGGFPGEFDDGTLIGSCRSARIREDTSIFHFQDSFKVQSLMKQTSFKY